ncbi:peptide chain release factor 1, partial [Plasmodium cynomolgi strain B]
NPICKKSDSISQKNAQKERLPSTREKGKPICAEQKLHTHRIPPGSGGRRSVALVKGATYKTFAERINCRVERVHGQEIKASLYDLFKNESGIHQVKRVPQNESKGKIHSSTATIAVFLHEEEYRKDEVNLKDLRITTFRSSKPGGQNVNKIESGVSILHKPTGILTECQEERTQEMNKKIAMKRLTQKIFQLRHKQSEEQLRRERAKLIKNSNRSSRIRTYNIFRGYITDHVTKRKLDLMYFVKVKLEFLLNVDR